MKRRTRKTMAIIIGLCLGWYFAGLAPNLMPGAGVTLAENKAAGPEGTSPKKPEHPHPHPTKKAHDHHTSADKLVPKHDGHPTAPSWFRTVIFGVVMLFFAAVVLGVPALVLKGPEPPEPVDDHGHDHHGHDDAGHADH